MENIFSACAIGIFAAHIVTVPNGQEGGWRHDDDLVLECEEIWLGELQKALERVMVLKRRAKLGWQANDDNLVTVDLHDNSGERVVTPEPDPRHVKLLREACGLKRSRRCETRQRTTTMKRC